MLPLFYAVGTSGLVILDTLTQNRRKDTAFF